jgi:predicted nucleic acid-binding protein
VNSVLLDTSFLITLSDPARERHDVALRYYKECISRHVPMMLSSVVISEFHVRQSVNDLELRNFIVLPFNVDHAMSCGLLLREMLANREHAEDRVRVKDDMKLAAQCQCEGISHILTEDANTLVRYVARFRDVGRMSTQTVLLTGGFDVSWFEAGQHRLV